MKKTTIAALVWLLAGAGCAGADRPAVRYASGAPQSGDDNVDLARCYAEDQADRLPPDGTAIDWTLVMPRDKAREQQVKALYCSGALHTAADFHHAAMILQHADAPDDYLLAHELCVVAIAKGDASALWLCAASEDRFLGSIERPQRFGTQYVQHGPDGPLRLAPVAAGVTDGLREQFRVPGLQLARNMEEQLNAAGK